MPESPSHRRAKKKAAGETGQTEVRLPSGARLDAATLKRATEVERSGHYDRLVAAALRLRESGKSQKVLQVPQPHMDLAVRAMREVGVKGTVKNLSGTKRRSV